MSLDQILMLPPGYGFDSSNAAPGIAVPGAQSAVSNIALAITGTSIADADSNPQTVTLSVSHGTLTLASTTGLSFAVGDGTADAVMTFTGSVANVNTALATIAYTTTADYVGADTLTIDSTDSAGGVATQKTIAITATFAFTSLTGLRYVLDPNTLSYTDAGTTLATNDGDVIYRQAASNDPAFYVEHATLANRPVLKIGANGKRALLANGTNVVLTSASITIDTGEVTLFGLYRCDWQTDKYRPIIGVGYAASNGMAIVTSGSAFNDWLAKSIIATGDGYLDTQDPRNVAPYGALVNGTYHTVIAVFSATRAELYIDGVLVTPTASGTGAVPSLTAALSICGAPITNDFSDGYHPASGICDAAISATQVGLLHTLLAAQALT